MPGGVSGWLGGGVGRATFGLHVPRSASHQENATRSRIPGSTRSTQAWQKWPSAALFARSPSVEVKQVERRKSSPRRRLRNAEFCKAGAGYQICMPGSQSCAFRSWLNKFLVLSCLKLEVVCQFITHIHHAEYPLPPPHTYIPLYLLQRHDSSVQSLTEQTKPTERSSTTAIRHTTPGFAEIFVPPSSPGRTFQQRQSLKQDDCSKKHSTPTHLLVLDANGRTRASPATSETALIWPSSIKRCHKFGLTP